MFWQAQKTSLEGALQGSVYVHTHIHTHTHTHAHTHTHKQIYMLTSLGDIVSRCCTRWRLWIFFTLLLAYCYRILLRNVFWQAEKKLFEGVVWGGLYQSASQAALKREEERTLGSAGCPATSGIYIYTHTNTRTHILSDQLFALQHQAYIYIYIYIHTHTHIYMYIIYNI